VSSGGGGFHRRVNQTIAGEGVPAEEGEEEEEWEDREEGLSLRSKS
jgi:hypothetical protein